MGKMFAGAIILVTGMAIGYAIGVQPSDITTNGKKAPAAKKVPGTRKRT